MSPLSKMNRRGLAGSDAHETPSGGTAHAEFVWTRFGAFTAFPLRRDLLDHVPARQGRSVADAPGDTAVVERRHIGTPEIQACNSDHYVVGGVIERIARQSRQVRQPQWVRRSPGPTELPAQAEVAQPRKKIAIAVNLIVVISFSSGVGRDGFAGCMWETALL